MSSYPYTVPSSPTYGFFPSGTTSPHAFASFHQSPRDTHNMYAAAFASSASSTQPQNGSSQSQSSNRQSKYAPRNSSMPPSRNSTVPVATVDVPDITPYSLALLSEYTHTLDTLPIDLSRNFGELREVDAVLSASITNFVSKIDALTQMIEQGTVSKKDRLWLLSQIAEEATRLKVGGDDKIRMACIAADNLKSHMGHLRTLAELLPNFDASTLDRRTTYPHVAARSFMPVLPPENTRRRRGAYGSLLVATGPDLSPAKKRQRVLQRDDDLDIIRSPKKDKNDSNARSRARGGRKTDRAASPSESLVSVTSYNITQPNGTTTYRGAGNNSNPRGAGTTSGAKRSRPSAGNRSATPHTGDPYDQNGIHPNGNGGSTSSRRDAYNISQSSHHTSHSHPYPNGSVPNGSAPHQHHANANPYDMHIIQPGLQDWNSPLAQQLEGPGMPVSRAVMPIIPINTPVGPGVPGDAAVDAGDGDGDGDDRRYCFCNGISYGEMIACDDSSCEREWMAVGFARLVVRNEIQNGRDGVGNGEQVEEELERVLHDESDIPIVTHMSKAS
ncbi:hypothetical protein H0H93_005796 [Arthromyces matolae]|nr:hypothetical protein H0H93_005796 [Arthromyces matolae]